MKKTLILLVSLVILIIGIFTFFYVKENNKTSNVILKLPNEITEQMNTVENGLGIKAYALKEIDNKISFYTYSTGEGLIANVTTYLLKDNVVINTTTKAYYSSVKAAKDAVDNKDFGDNNISRKENMITFTNNDYENTSKEDILSMINTNITTSKLLHLDYYID